MSQLDTYRKTMLRKTEEIAKLNEDLAKEQAKLQGRRAIILETQSCNVRAIAFYQSQGFELIGFDSCCYTNLDVERHEIRFDFGYFLHKREGRWEK